MLLQNQKYAFQKAQIRQAPREHRVALAINWPGKCTGNSDMKGDRESENLLSAITATFGDETRQDNGACKPAQLLHSTSKHCLSSCLLSSPILDLLSSPCPQMDTQRWLMVSAIL